MNTPCPTCRGQGNLWHRIPVLEDDYNIPHEFVDLKLYCGRCLGRKMICETCFGVGYTTLKIPYGGNIDQLCSSCKGWGAVLINNSETQKIET